MCNSDHFCFTVMYLNLNVSMYAYIGAVHCTVVMLVMLLFLSTLPQSKPVQLTILYTVFSIVF